MYNCVIRPYEYYSLWLIMTYLLLIVFWDSVSSHSAQQLFNYSQYALIAMLAAELVCKMLACVSIVAYFSDVWHLYVSGPRDWVGRPVMIEGALWFVVVVLSILLFLCGSPPHLGGVLFLCCT